MCFSAGADVAAGIVIGAIGIDGLRHVRRPAELWLASVPLVLAAHQLVEAVVWLGLQGQVVEEAWKPALGVYLTIAFGVLPVLVPIAVGSLEPPDRRRQLRWFGFLGVAVAGVLMSAVVRGPVDAHIHNLHIEYSVDLWHGGVVVALYVVATCGPTLFSRFARVRWFGMVNIVVAAVLAWLMESAFISLWCLWAALASVAIVVHLRLADTPPPGGVGPLSRPVGSPPGG
jgi:hypothetical protein